MKRILYIHHGGGLGGALLGTGAAHRAVPPGSASPDTCASQPDRAAWPVAGRRGCTPGGLSPPGGRHTGTYP